MCTGRVLGGLSLLLALLALAPTASASTPLPGYQDTIVTAGLTEPTAIAFLPGGELLVAEQRGALKLVSGGTTSTLATIPVCTFPDRYDEMGLLGVAVDPDFESNGFIYLYRTKAAPSGCETVTGRFNQVVRVTMQGGTIDPASLTELLSGIRTDTGGHNGGTVRVGPDEKLYVSVGDTGTGDGGDPPPGGSTNPYAQDLNALEGKVLRLELDGSPAAGNPFLGQAGKRGEIWAYGFRNPWRFGFDPVTGLPWLGDAGQGAMEELDIVQAGGNYAWPHCEGTLPIGCQQPGDIDPIFEYPHSGPESLGQVIVGGAFAPSGFGALGGRYFFADPAVSKIYSAVPNASHDGLTGTPADFVTDAAGYPVDIVFGPDGLYYVTYFGGQVRRVSPTFYPRPKSASRVSVSLVPAYAPCGSPNREHGPPLGYGSCTPPDPASDQLTVGTADSNGQAANSVGSVSFRVVIGDPSTPQNEADVGVAVSVTDVRHAIGLTDYTGELQASPSIRITDRNNGASGADPATTADMQFPVTASCAATAGSIGATCSVDTSFNAIVPGAVVERKRAIWQLGSVEVFDGGGDGVAATEPNTLFARQGVFIP